MLALVSGGCGSVGGTQTDATPQVHNDAPADTRNVDALVVLDASCRDVKQRLATATDGVYWIDPDLSGAAYKPFQVFCANMSTATPEEFLELKRTSSPTDNPPASNYSTYATGTPHANWTCSCGVLTWLFSKVRINPTTLVASGDQRFEVYSNSTNVACTQQMTGCPQGVPYGAAQSCIDALNGPNTAGRANIDLRDVPFHIDGVGTDNSMFIGAGFNAMGTATIDSARKVVDLTGGGDCGGWGVWNGLQLAQDF